MQKGKEPLYAVVSPLGEGITDTAVPLAEVDKFEIGDEPQAWEKGIGDEPQAWEKGNVQERGYRDVNFAIAFVLHLVLVIGLAICFWFGIIETTGGSGVGRKLDEYFSKNENNEGEDDFWGSNGGSDTDSTNEDMSFSSSVVWVISSVSLVSIILAPTLAVLALGMMKEHAIWLIKFSLYFSIGINVFLFFVMIFFSPYSSIIHGIVAAILVCYARAVWNRIPYAASNLRSAITAIKANLGVSALAFGAVPVSIVWILLWTYTIASTFQTDFMKNQIEEEHDAENQQTETISFVGWLTLTFFILSFYWTSQVVKNTVHTTIAGVIGAWWFTPVQASSCCSKEITESLGRSTSYSFGSICFGSLIVAIIEVIQNFLRSARNNRNGGILRLIALCCLTWIEGLAEYFNKWAFIYVGLYGYSYIEAGKNVFTLFQARGWSTIISDRLVSRMLGIMCLGIGFAVGLISVLVALLTGGRNGFLIAAAGIIGLLVGIIMSSIMMNVVISSVDSIIVLYAEAPAEFHETHPELAKEMDSTWTVAWPDVFGGGVAPAEGNLV